MNLFALSSLFLAQAQAPQGGSFLGSPIVLMVIMFVLLWVIIIRPQKKAQKEQQERINSLEIGDKIITSSGIHGTIEFVASTTVRVKISKDTIIDLEKSAVVFVDKGNATPTSK